MSSDNPNHPPGPYPPGQHVIPPPRPSSPATAEYRLNHLMLRIKDPEKSLRFYNDCFGLHVVFIFNVGPWTIYYLGPRDVCKYHTFHLPHVPSSLLGIIAMRSIGTSKGLLELYHVPGDSSLTYTSGNDYASNPAGIGFGHIGFTVPDPAKAIERVKSFGYEVIKPLGDVEEEKMGIPVDRGGDPLDDGYKQVWRQLAFVKDPDVSFIIWS
jgi:lactoylglutathione lyase